MTSCCLCHLHRIDPEVPLANRLGTLHVLRDEGKIGHIGLSVVASEDIRRAGKEVTTAAVQNVLNMTDRHHPALELCRDLGIPYVPYRPLDAGTPAKSSRSIRRPQLASPARRYRGAHSHHEPAAAPRRDPERRNGRRLVPMRTTPASPARKCTAGPCAVRELAAARDRSVPTRPRGGRRSAPCRHARSPWPRAPCRSRRER
ncbi:aldo/keto reductase [Streptomyces sp. NPDC097727]|uniref:aldo/keto reductase n=1 Tax=Streptomyces sp. NPDC097727 TaxID=3366092 RepID=UPI003800D4B0